jgi:hypothetical protein
MSLGQFTTRSLSGVANLAGEFAVNITTEHLRYVLPDNFNPEAWSMSFWFIPDWDNTDGLRHFIASLYLDEDNFVHLEKDASGDLLLTYVGQAQAAVTVSRTVAFSSGTPVFVGIAVDGTGFQAPSFARRYIYLAADQNGDDSLEYVFDGFFGSSGQPLINALLAGTYTLHVGSDENGGFSLDGAVSIAITNDQDNTPINDRFNGGQGLALLGSDSWIVRWCERLVIAISGEASGNVRADTFEGSIDLMDAEDEGVGKLEFAIGDHDWVEFGDTDIFDGLAAGTFFFDFLNGQTSAGHILAGRFRLAGNNNRQWLASFQGQGELNFQINIDPSPGGEGGSLHTIQRWALLNQRIAWIVRYDGSQPDDFGPTGKMRTWISYFSSVGALNPPNTGVFNPEQMWTPFRELNETILQNLGTGPFPSTFKSAISATNYRWSSFDDQQGTSPLRGDYYDCRFNLNRALDPAEIEAMNPSAFVRSQWTHRWGMVLNAAGEVPEDFGSGLDGELMSVSGDGPDEATDRSFVQGQFPEVVTEGVFAFDGDGDLILTTDPGDEADIELTRLSLPGDSSVSGGNRAETADTPALDVLIGDLDLRVEMRRDSYTDGPTQFSQQTILTKTNGFPDRVFDWAFSGFGTFVLTVYRDDGQSFGFAIFEHMPEKLSGKRLWVRCAFVLDDGSGNRRAIFYYSETWDGVSADDGETWIEVGRDTDAGVISPALNTGSDMELGSSSFNQFSRLRADVFRAQVRDGIDGTIVWDPNFEAEAPGTTSFTEDANGLTVDIVQFIPGTNTYAQIANGLQRVTWGWWGRIGRISPVVETIFGRWDGTDNQFRIARNGADIRVYISSGGASEDDYADFVLGMQGGEKWKFIVVYVGSGPWAYPQSDPPKGIRITLYAYLFDEATGQWGSRQEPAASYTGLIPQQLVPSALGYVWANADFAGEVDETRVWNDAELDQIQADFETVYS